MCEESCQWEIIHPREMIVDGPLRECSIVIHSGIVDQEYFLVALNSFPLTFYYSYQVAAH